MHILGCAPRRTMLCGGVFAVPLCARQTLSIMIGDLSMPESEGWRFMAAATA